MKALLLALALLAGCYVQHYPVTPQVAEAGTYELIVGDSSGPQIQGTAWVVAPNYLVTAGHMCLTGTGSAYTAISSTGRSVPATVVAWELSETADAKVVTDLCLLHSDSHLADPLILAPRMPAIGATVHYVGWPDGQFTGGDGTYLGDTDGPDAHEDDYTTSAATDHGASGSAMFTSDGVFGILVRLRTSGGATHDGKDGSVVTPIKLLLPVLQDEGVAWTSPPFNPDDPFPVEGM